MLPQAPNVSARTEKILAVLERVRRSQPSAYVQARACRREAQIQVAAERGIAVESVVDSCTRQLDWNTDQFDHYVWRWFAAGEDALRRRLREFAAQGHQASDCQAIDRFFAEPRGAPTRVDVPITEDPVGLVREMCGRPVGGKPTLSAEHRRALRQFAMDMAEDYYAECGWSQIGPSHHNGYDLRVARPGDEMHVVARGVVPGADSILLTHDNVEHARRFPKAELFLVTDITFSRGPSGLMCEDYSSVLTLPIVIGNSLVPLCYRYLVHTNR